MDRLPALSHPRTVVATLALLVAGLVTGSVVLASGPPDGTDAAIEEPGQPSASYAPPTPSATGDQSPEGSPRPSETAPTSEGPATQRPTESPVSRGGDRGTDGPDGGATSPPEAPTPTATPTPQEQAAAPPQTSATTRNANAGRWVIGVSADEDATFECSLDGGGYEPCGTTVAYDDLDEGTHTFSARATDGDGDTDPTPAELTAEIDGRGKD